jgi:Rrf2 family protein
MRIAAKTRYALAALVKIGLNYGNGQKYTVSFLSENLDISKIFLEQVFSELKKAKIVNSSKGSQGGYTLAKSPETISVYDIFSAIDNAVFEKADRTLTANQEIENALSGLFSSIDIQIEKVLKAKYLSDLCNESKEDSSMMFYI